MGKGTYKRTARIKRKNSRANSGKNNPNWQNNENTEKPWNRSFGYVLKKLKDDIRDYHEFKGKEIDEESLKKLTVEDFFRPTDEFSQEEWHRIICENKWNDEDIKSYWTCRHMLGWRTKLDREKLYYAIK